jgi:DMSO/TMAO reductase YedYZ molybdopterin-dependent catalytic subunit
MPAAGLDRLLATLLLAVGGTGLLTLRAGNEDLAWLFVVHELLAGSLLAAVLLKLRQSIPRAVARQHWLRLGIGLVLSLPVVASLAAGYAWVASGALPIMDIPWLGSVTVLALHVWLGLALLPILAVHLLPKRWRLLRPGPTALAGAPRRLLARRSLLAVVGLGAISLGALGAAEVLERIGGKGRRFTGSRLLNPGGVPPATTFFGEATPNIDPSTWRLRVGGRVARPAALTIGQLQALGETELKATLDCTSGWALTTSWHGVPLQAVLDLIGAEPAATRVEVRSVTGWGAAFGLEEAQGLLLATSVAGGDLPIGNGAPCRLVAPGRRGLDWVKWVTEIRVS